MSQRDFVAELRAARLAAPPEVRERVRLIAAADTTKPPRAFTWRRALVLAVPVAAGLAAAVVFTRPSHHEQALQAQRGSLATPARHHAAQKVQTLTSTFKAATPATRAAGAAVGAPELAPAPSPRRAQRYGASLELRVPTPVAVSDSVKRALRIVASLGGYAVSVNAVSARKTASAELVLKVPRTHVQQAVARLSQLGTIVGEQVEVQDLQSGLNGTDRTIARLQRARAATIRSARLATVQLSLATRAASAPKHHGHGPLHGLGVAFRWLGIGLVYALALGAPAVLVAAAVWLVLRAVRRRRVDALLSRP